MPEITSALAEGGVLVSFSGEERAELIGAPSRTADMVSGLLTHWIFCALSLKPAASRPRTASLAGNGPVELHHRSRKPLPYLQ
jgi:hypothetical protein